ncbi:MAG: Uma2 family endonuclease [Clostridiales bacterium]|jgi:Uma2 family endonuclease|nr:Uma2 family endonuclease [Clostridiales bacterium]
MTNLAHKYEDERRTEMLDGVIYMMATPGLRHHIVSNAIYKIFDRYLHRKSCMAFSDGFKVFLTENDRSVPDAMVVCNKDIIKNDGVYGAPDLIVEILSPSTAKRDRSYKKNLYESCGVKEYWIVDASSLSIEVYWLVDRKYILHNIFTILPEYEKRDMPAEKLAEFPLQFKTPLFDDLTIDLQEIFQDIREDE